MPQKQILVVSHNVISHFLKYQEMFPSKSGYMPIDHFISWYSGISMLIGSLINHRLSKTYMCVLKSHLHMPKRNQFYVSYPLSQNTFNFSKLSFFIASSLFISERWWNSEYKFCPQPLLLSFTKKLKVSYLIVSSSKDQRIGNF